MIRFGVADYGMNVWTGGLYDIAERLELLREIGYAGTERLEAVSEADALHKAALYRRMNMDFATCRGPSVQAGLEWTAGLGKEYVWLTPGQADRQIDMELYIRRSRDFSLAARRWGLRPALHNHLGQRVESQDELEYFLERCPEADLLLDVGHLVGAGGDPAAVIRRYPGRLAAVHVKDIRINRPECGLDRWTERLQFCQLGAGNIGFSVAPAMAALKEAGYSGWVFVEQDTHTDDMADELAQSLAELRKAL